jgi:hypothetical protein
MSSAVIYRRHDGFYIHSESKTTAGVWMASEPFLKVELNASAVEKGKALLEALNASKESVPHPADWDKVFQPMLDLARVDDWSSFMRRAGCVTADAESDQIIFVPHRNVGENEGHVPKRDQMVELPINSSFEYVGASLDRAMASCD